ncbi:hypothetical protein Pan44_53380 [Caulifigura coniformis]|uniref:Type II secretion system protein GspC N-terminal domain-containing protein n=1 Tax=Caulifigura coniformis TaxID=2527983 RepID=A0A517SMC1_9PLAN|nr:hypothetical protein [Caulifigura coniformis]QDT57270.1 hypothetical protein Pan44_53380 [Caulifigura coniformis]
MRGRQAKRWLGTAIVGELIAALLVGVLAWRWPIEDVAETEAVPKTTPLQVVTEMDDSALPTLTKATEAAKKILHRPLFDRPPVVAKPEPPRPPKKLRPGIKLIGTIADPSGNRGIFETTPEHTEVRRAGERFEQLPAVLVKRIDQEKALLQIESEDFEIAIVGAPIDEKTP